MAESHKTDSPTAASGHAPVLRVERPSARHRAVSGGVRGVFARRDGRWVLENESELSVLVGLGANREGMSRLRAMAAALNAGVAGPGDLARLGGCLRSLAESYVVFWVRVPEDLMAAVTVACAHWDHQAAEEWLCWALAQRLAGNLSDALEVEAGWLSWDAWYEERPPHTWWRGTGWMEELDSSFWDRLASHENPRVRAALEASDPSTGPSQLQALVASSDSRLEVLDMVASHPRARPNCFRSSPTQKSKGLTSCGGG